MMEDIKTHAIHYFFLALILIPGLLGFWYFSYNPAFQRAIVIAIAMAYVFWGIIHHFLESNLNFKIVVEYTFVAALAATLLLIIIGFSA